MDVRMSRAQDAQERPLPQGERGRMNDQSFSYVFLVAYSARLRLIRSREYTSPPTRPVLPMQSARDLFSYRKYWAKRFGTAPFLPMSRAEMDALGWDSCDVVLVTGDAYVDHPSFGMAIVGRVLEAQGFRVGIIAQPDWRGAEPFEALGRPNLFFGITAGNMDSMVNRYTADRKIRSDDAYTPGDVAGKRPDRSVIVYAQRAREAFTEVPIVIGGIEASLRRIAHYDYWSDKVRRSILVDAKADLLIYGNGERQISEVAHRLAAGESIASIADVRGTAFARKGIPDDWSEIDSSQVDKPGPLNPPVNPYATEEEMRTPTQSNSLSLREAKRGGREFPVDIRAAERVQENHLHPGGNVRVREQRQEPFGQSSLTPTPLPKGEGIEIKVIRFERRRPKLDPTRTVIRLPSFEQVANDRVL